MSLASDDYRQKGNPSSLNAVYTWIHWVALKRVSWSLCVSLAVLVASMQVFMWNHMPFHRSRFLECYLNFYSP